MKLAIDSSVMIGILGGKHEFKPWSELLIDLACKGNQIVACGVVWAEVSSEYEDEADLRQDMKDRGVVFDALEPASCYNAGCMFRQYKKNCRHSRKKGHDDPPIDLHEGNATGVVSAIDLLPEVYALECLTLLS